MTDLAEIDPKEALATLEGETLSLWSDEKKTDYCKLLAKRTKVARYILLSTASLVMQKAEAKKFISQKHRKAIAKGFVSENSGRYHDSVDLGRVFNPQGLVEISHTSTYEKIVGGRSTSSLDVIADERADEILKSLPPLKKVVEIIDVETSGKIRRKEKLIDDGQVLKEELDGVCGTLHMESLDQSMTIGEFRKIVYERENRRLALIRKLNGISNECRALEEDISKALYAGLPGLSDAVVDVVRSYIEQSYALEETNRRIEEQVQFGDSEAALAVLRQFEKDEVQISSAVADKFKTALEELKLSVTKGRTKRRPSTKELKT